MKYPRERSRIELMDQEMVLGGVVSEGDAVGRGGDQGDRKGAFAAHQRIFGASVKSYDVHGTGSAVKQVVEQKAIGQQGFKYSIEGKAPEGIEPVEPEIDADEIANSNDLGGEDAQSGGQRSGNKLRKLEREDKDQPKKEKDDPLDGPES
jgi:hypothetical protein